MMTWNRPETDQYRFGSWSFQLRDDEIADLRYDDGRVLRSVRAVIRDADWDTMPLVVDSMTVGATGVEMLVHTDGSLAFSGVVRIDVDGADFTVAMDLVSSKSVETNRTGLVVLHPPQLAGKDLLVRHSDGTTENTRYPEQISPHQPVLDITRLRWADDDVDVDVRFDGDVFEMEDQRNWTDASFKTYSRPLSLPFPYSISADEHVVQSVSVRADAAHRTSTVPVVSVLHLHEAGSFPAVGVEASTAPDPGAASTDGIFRTVELNLTTLTWPAALARAAADGLPLDVRLVTDRSPGPLAEVATALATHQILQVAAFDVLTHVSDAETVSAARAALTSAGISVTILGGARSHFTELNRERHRLPQGLDGLVITTTPLFHSTDTEQLVEALEMQRLVATRSTELADGLPVHIGPISLRPRFNNVASTIFSAPTRNDLRDGYGAELSGSNDPRQFSPELASWTIASAAALGIPGVKSLSWFETWGPRGIRDRTGEPGPTVPAIAALIELTGRSLLWAESPDGLIWALGGRGEGDDVVLISNAGRDSREIEIRIGDDPTPHEVTLEANEWTRLTLPRHRVASHLG